ncbi:MAG TPA: Trk system potassium transporter TrkA [Pirellulaceae bacterium]|nr:Trk system potassium transporter TrkA [Pirellulaceae bacterium]
MNVIVVGTGEVGFHIAERLSKEGHNVTVIEKNSTKESLLKAKLDALVVRGNGASAEVLEQAGIARADLFVAVTDQDEVNLVASMLAHECGTKRIIARIKSLEYTSVEWAQHARKLGIDLLISPQNVVAEEIYRIVSYAAASEAAEFAGGRVVFLGYAIGRGSPLAGITLKEMAGIRGVYRMVITAIARKHETIIPRGEDAIQEGDIVYFVCTKQDLPAINYLFDLEKTPTKSVFILGGDRIGEALARKLTALAYRVKLIERDAAQCERLAGELDGVAVLNTEGTDIETLKHEGISSCDAYLAVTANEQTNILCSLLAKSYGAKRAIALVDRHEFVTLAPSLGVDACVSPRLATASAILRYVRPTGIASLATIEHSNAEVLEVVIPVDSGIVKRPLKEIAVPSGAIIGVIVRGDQVVIPSGEDHLEADDHVIVFTLPQAIARVEQYFS